jgi:peptidoglycan/xylan/chitin deacetylase (PgdA/CDA1 family)
MKYGRFTVLFFLLITLYMLPATAERRDASSAPPGDLLPKQVPQFVVLGFDDNTTSSGIEWALSLLTHRKNPRPKNKENESTFDGTPLQASFYMNTRGFTDWHEDNPQNLIYAVKKARLAGHEIANHTHNHHADLRDDNFDKYTQNILNIKTESWQKRIQQCTDLLINESKTPKTAITGFRAPYLVYSRPMFSAIEKTTFLYDSSIEEGFSSKFDGTNFRWPYTLDKGSPGHDESWVNNEKNPHHVSLKPISGLWELPNYALIIPKDHLAKKYQFKKGLWKRMKKHAPYLGEHRITGFDYNLWVNAKLNEEEVLAILKYNLDLRLEGNRAPFTFGIHSQYYTDPVWQQTYAPQVSLTDMQEAISAFVDYALTKPDVRFRSSESVIEWCKKPVAL